MTTPGSSIATQGDPRRGPDPGAGGGDPQPHRGVLAGGVGQAGQQLAQVAGLLLGGQQQRGGHQVGGLGSEGPQRAGSRCPWWMRAARAVT